MSDSNVIPIRQWAEDDRPREKLLLKGKGALTDVELLATILGSGSRSESAVGLARRILSTVDYNLNSLGRLTVRQLMDFRGVGQAKAVAIAAALELGKRRRESELAETQKISSSASVFHLMQPVLGDLLHEEFWVIYLNNSNKIVFKMQLSKGGIVGTVVDIRLALKPALEHNAVGLILVHNHPSGALTPSEADKSITRKIQKAAELLDLRVLDHVIVTEKAYLSFADDGLL